MPRPRKSKAPAFEHDDHRKNVELEAAGSAPTIVTESGPTTIPTRIPLCPLRASVIYPPMVMPVDAGRPVSVGAINAAFDREERIVLTVAQRDKDVDEPKQSDLYTVGTVCQILRMRKNPDGTVQMLIQASKRARISKFHSGAHIEATIEILEEDPGDPREVQALKRELEGKFEEVLKSGKFVNPEAVQFIHGLEDAGQIADHITFNLEMKLEDKQAILEATSVPERIRKLLVFLDGELELMEMQKRIQQQVKEEIDRNQREYFLREQMKAIQRELHGNDDDDEVEGFRAKINALGLAEEVKNEVERELNRMSRMHPDSAEASVIRTYLTWITELPWNGRSDDQLDIKAAEKMLEEDHYGLEKVKDRVLEFLAVRQLRKQRAEKGELDVKEVNKGPILVFVGPPGVGKTSIAKSIAKSLGRKYVRISLGGARDEADIRGHRRTYIGALPGRIIQGLKTAGTKNPVFLLDEIDKLGASYQGDPSSALLEVLDPAQNGTFVDHYLGVPFDLSEVMFIATANYPEQIPAPLLDRMEFIEFNSYIEAEKLEIAKRYIVPRQIEENGLKLNQVMLTDAALQKVIQQYTREAGVRTLEREIGSLLRKAARRVATSEIKRVRITESDLEKYLGPQRYQIEQEGKEDIVGVSTGMFYTPVGGDILFVETSVMPGKGLVLTGQLGDVMKESARAALSYAKKNSARFHLPLSRIDDSEIHVHIPAGAIPKEGPSAGVALTTSLVSALTEVPARHDVSMTGEITLTGRVLPIGGLKEKVLGARRAGIKHVILPKQNEADLEDIPLHLRRSMTFHAVEHLDQVLDIALVGGLKSLENAAIADGRKKKPRKAPRLPAAPA